MTDGPRTIRVDYLSRVEGEGGLFLKLRGERVEEVRLDIFEPPRFFEALLRGRACTEAPDITARICGICPVAYQMSAVHAVERALGVEVPAPVRALRRLLYCGEWIESHALHIHLLHAPDFLGYPDAVAMARDHRDAVQRGLRIKQAGNALMALLGGREIHPINVRVGGFYKAPARGDLAPFVDRLRRARDEALEVVRWVAGFACPDVDRDWELVALRHPTDYPMNEGRVASTGGLDVDAADFEAHVVEEHMPHTTALHARLVARGAYLVGPLARYALNAERLTPLAAAAAREAGLGDACRNPYRSVVVRAVEVVFACEEALRLIECYEPPAAPAVPLVFRAGTGHACTEAPRGLLYHRYRLEADGTIAEARIVPPTSQNQRTIEADLAAVVPRYLGLPDDELRERCEQVIRNHDPCISCATHFLQLRVDRA